MSHRMSLAEAEGQIVPSFWEEAAEALGLLNEDVQLSDIAEDLAMKFGPQEEYTACCLSGHVLTFSRQEMLSIFDVDTVLDIEFGLRAEPPVVPLGECYPCSVLEQALIRQAA